MSAQLKRYVAPPVRRRGETKRVVSGLGARVMAFRQKRGISLQVACETSGLSIPRWRDAESFNLATDDTLSKLASAGVDLTGIAGR